jgi:hypothetical protein
MSTVLPDVLAEHGRLRELLKEVITRAAAARLGDGPARLGLAHAVEELKRALHGHALAEGAHGRSLDEIHDAEDAAAIQLRCASGLEDVLRHAGEIADLLEEEERILGMLEAGQTAAP